MLVVVTTVTVVSISEAPPVTFESGGCNGGADGKFRSGMGRASEGADGGGYIGGIYGGGNGGVSNVTGPQCTQTSSASVIYEATLVELMDPNSCGESEGSASKATLTAVAYVMLISQVEQSTAFTAVPVAICSCVSTSSRNAFSPVEFEKNGRPSIARRLRPVISVTSAICWVSLTLRRADGTNSTVAVQLSSVSHAACSILDASCSSEMNCGRSK